MNPQSKKAKEIKNFLYIDGFIAIKLTKKGRDSLKKAFQKQ